MTGKREKCLAPVEMKTNYGINQTQAVRPLPRFDSATRESVSIFSDVFLSSHRVLIVRRDKAAMEIKRRFAMELFTEKEREINTREKEKRRVYSRGRCQKEYE